MDKRLLRPAALALLALAVQLASAPALADGPRHGHGRARVGVGIYLGPYLYPAPPHFPAYEYPAPVVVVPAAPPQYIERDDLPTNDAAPQPPTYWYHCAKPEGYYPYIKECPGGWTEVPAEPAR